MFTTSQTLHSFDGDMIGTGSADTGAHFIEEISCIDNFRFTSGIFNNRGTFG